jgi:hypothetical protein
MEPQALRARSAKKETAMHTLVLFMLRGFGLSLIGGGFPKTSVTSANPNGGQQGQAATP